MYVISTNQKFMNILCFQSTWHGSHVMCRAMQGKIHTIQKRHPE